MNARPLRLAPGTDLRRALEQAARSEGAQSAFVIAGLGSLVDAKLRYAGENSDTTVAGPIEIVQLSGTLSASGVHLHMSVADAQGRVYGGHVGFDNVVRTTAEIMLADLPAWHLSREVDPATGFKELVVRPRAPVDAAGLTTRLVRMEAAAYPLFFEEAVAGYAADNVASGRWAEADARDLARAETERLLPDGIATPDHHLFEIREAADGPPVGFLWAAAMSRGTRQVAYIYQLMVLPAFRRRGHARRALLEFETIALGMGFHAVALNVFASNDGAQALYRSVGFEPVSMNMQKVLAPGAGV